MHIFSSDYGRFGMFLSNKLFFGTPGVYSKNYKKDPCFAKDECE